MIRAIRAPRIAHPGNDRARPACRRAAADPAIVTPLALPGTFDISAVTTVATDLGLIEFRDKLRPGGYLLLGHSESLPVGIDGFTACGRTTYRKQS